MSRKETRSPSRPEPSRWASWARASRGTALTSRRGLRVEVKRHDGGWAVRPGDHPDIAWAYCSDPELERTLGLTLGLDGAEARALARHVRALR
jgi:hypothetical protein